MKEVVHLLLDEIAHILIHRHSVGAHRQRAQLDLGLALKHRFLHVDGNGRHDAVSDIAVFEVLVVELLDGLGNVLLERALMGAALRGVLSVYERIVLLAILVGMGKGYLDVLALHVDDGIHGVGGHGIGEQVFQTVARKDASPVVHDGQTRIKIGIVAQHRLHEIIMETVVFEQCVVGFKEDIGAALIGSFLGYVGDEFTALKLCRAHFAVAIGTHLEARTQEVDGLDAHTIHSHGFLERLRVVFTAGIQLADGLYHLLLRNATSVVAERHPKVVLDINLDALAFVHAELIDRVVNGFLEQHIDTVFGMGAVTQSANIHTGTGADMLNVGEMADAGGVVRCYVFIINIFFCHIYWFQVSGFKFFLKLRRRR